MLREHLLISRPRHHPFRMLLNILAKSVQMDTLFEAAEQDLEEVEQSVSE